MKGNEQIILEIRYMKDKSFYGFIDNVYFNRWYNQTEMELFKNSFDRACKAMGKDLSSRITSEK